MKLSEKRCIPCEAGAKPMDIQSAEKLLKQLPKGWSLSDGKKIVKTFKFKSYPDTMAFVNRAALIAQDEGHHPDMQVGYSNVIVEISTHSIGGLSENDFILASKIDE
jgi:4a-hydroxytetrahydrobiopterin dehydratase